MTSDDALRTLHRTLGGTPSNVILSVEDFRAAVKRMSCFAVWRYRDLIDGRRVGLVAWADTDREPLLYIAWEWVQVNGEVVGMRDANALATNVTLVDTGRHQVGMTRRQIEFAAAAHSLDWWTRVAPAWL
jgi:hypothetical protein